MGINVGEAYNGLTYRFSLKDMKAVIPVSFVADNKGLPGAKTTKSAIWIAGDTLVLEAPISTCGICGENVHSTDLHTYVHACPSCAEHLGKGKIIHTMTETLNLKNHNK